MKEQRAFEKSVAEKTRKGLGESIVACAIESVIKGQVRAEGRREKGGGEGREGGGEMGG